MQRHVSLRPMCTADAAWHAHLGALLLATGQGFLAVESLERALSLRPDYPAAMMDYVTALFAIGDDVSARSLARTLLSRKDVPPEAATYLRSVLAPVVPGRWQWQAHAAAFGGWESNLNGAPLAREISLTLPGGDFVLPLDRSGRPREGWATLYEAAVTGVGASRNGATWIARAQTSLRDAAARRHDYVSMQGDLGWIRATPTGERLVLVGLVEQRLGGRALLRETRVSSAHRWLQLPCAPRLGLELSQRRFPGAALSNGLRPGVVFALRCDEAQWQYGGQMRFTKDVPDKRTRPGGEQRIAELSLNLRHHTEQYAASVEVRWAQLDDREGFSPLLGNGRPRQLRRSALQLELTRSLGPQWTAILRFDTFRQRSNLKLFDVDSRTLYLGTRYLFN